MRPFARATIRSWLFCLAFVIAITIPATAFAGMVTGTVTDADTGEPIAGAYIYANTLPDNDEFVTLTEADGTYVLNVPSDWAEFWVGGADGYRDVFIPQRDISGTVVLDVALERAVPSVMGEVTDANTGEPVPGYVVLYTYDPEFDEWYFADGQWFEGSYVFFDLEVGRLYDVRTEIYGYENQSSGSFEFTGDLQAWDFMLQAAATDVSGMITDLETGDPLSAYVYLYAWDYDLEEWYEVDSSWADEGYYAFGNLQENTYYTVFAYSWGYQIGMSEELFFTGEPLTADIALTRAAPGVSGTIESDSGEPLWGGVVLQTHDGDGEWYEIDWLWVEEGTYTFYGLTEDREYRVATDVRNYTDKISDPFTYAGELVTIDFILSLAAVEVDGTVIDAATDEPIDGSLVLYYIDHEYDEVWEWDWVDTDNGQYAFRDLFSGGEYFVQTDYRDYYNKESETFIADGTLRTFDFALDLAPVGVSGTITDAATGEPLWGGIGLMTYDAEYEEWTYVDDEWFEEGFYDFRGLVEGVEYHLETWVEDYVNQAVDFVYEGEPLVRDFQLDLAPIGVTGTITDAESAKPVTAEVVLMTYDADWDEWWDVSYKWADGGNYVFRGLYEGDLYAVGAFANGYEDGWSEPFTYEGTPLTVDLALTPLPTSAFGELTDAVTGKPISWAWVSAEYWDEEEEDWYGAGWADAEDGTYRLTGLEEGVKYRLWAGGYGYEPKVSDEFVFTGTPLEIDFQLDAMPPAVNGEITDASTGEPISAAITIEYFWEEEGVWVGDGGLYDGEYVFYDLEVGGQYRLSAEADGYVKKTAAPFVYNGTTVTLDFALAPVGWVPTFTITPSAGAGGAISPATAQTVDQGTNVSFTITPNTGYQIADVKVDGVSVGAVATYEFTNVTANHTIAATFAPTVVTVEPIAGKSRYGTAIAASQEAFPDGATSVVIATGSNWPDALGGASLAAAKGGPILLTQAGALPAEVLTEIRRLGATEAIVLGGEAAVGAPVVNALKAELGTSKVTRIGGKGRYETAELIAKATVAALGDEYDGTCFIATGGNFPDALGASPLAAAKGWPLLLAGPSGLSASTLGTIAEMGVTKTLILGGKAVVSDGVMTQLAGRAPQRLAGANRYDTARVVAEYGVANAGLGWDKVALATGANFPDALAGGVLQGRDNSVMLLTPSGTLADPAKTALTANKDSIHTVRFLGGDSAISQAVRAQVAALLN